MVHIKQDIKDIADYRSHITHYNDKINVQDFFIQPAEKSIRASEKHYKNYYWPRK